jgi:hypothetical protein
MTAANELTGQTISGIEILGRGPNDAKGNARWRCACSCGNEFLAAAYNLRNGKVRSCGCRFWATKHGMSRSALYGVWTGIHARCGNPKDTQYSNYGGRGIRVSDEWAEPIPFLDWARTNGYSPGLELDRIDNDGPYSPDNCRWTTRQANCNNRRITKYLEWGGKQVPLAELARQHGLDPSVLWSRLYSLNLPLDLALSFPADRQKMRVVLRQWRKSCA